ncbi:glycosyltransferase [Acidicapsa acidisoli]|uniref:glycosyltransferase n=1 Tax=Acidicapsa acidisoli TaxID=1615681 RepID=UPI0037C103BD
MNPLMVLSRQLTARGHRVTFFHKPEIEVQVRQHGLEFHPIDVLKPLSVETRRNDVCNNSSSYFAALSKNIDRIADDVKKSLHEIPSALARCGVDVLIVDEIVLAGPTLAQMLDIPYFIISTSVPLSFKWSVSRRSPSCRHQRSPRVWLQDCLLQVSVLRLRGPVRWRLDDYRRKAGLGPIRRMNKDFPAVAHIAQLPECLDFPRSSLPRNFYYTGPFVDDARPQVEFPWHRLDGRPLVYMSLGTARAVHSTIFRLVAKACNELNLQLVITLGGRSIPESFGDLVGRPVVVKEAPQLELVKRAKIVVTHSGLNTALETLRQGKPILAIPTGYDQPAVADRLAWLGVAEVLPAEGATRDQVISSLQKLLANQSYSTAALALRGKIRNVNGAERAADLIESALERHVASLSAKSNQQ